MEKEYRYMNFPVYLLRNIHSNKVEVINHIITYGIYRYGQTLKPKRHDVARQSIYMIYRADVPEFKDLIEQLDTVFIGKDEDYNGFSGETFNPEDEITEMLEVFDSYEIIEHKATELYRIHEALEFYDLTAPPERLLNSAKAINEGVPENNSMSMVKLDDLLNFLKSPKTDYEIDQLTAYSALRSIIGLKPYVKSNRKLLIARMLGYNKFDEVNVSELNSSPFKKYLDVRYQWDKLRDDLELYWKVKFYANKDRGFYFSDSGKLTYNDLIKKVEDNKKKRGLMISENLSEEQSSQQVVSNRTATIQHLKQCI